MPGHTPSAAKKNASYYGGDMRWMIWHGAAVSPSTLKLSLCLVAASRPNGSLGIAVTRPALHQDPIFPCNFTLTYWDNILDVLGAKSTLEIQHTEPAMSHTVVRPEIERMVHFVRG